MQAVYTVLNPTMLIKRQRALPVIFRSGQHHAKCETDHKCDQDDNNDRLCVNVHTWPPFLSRGSRALLISYTAISRPIIAACVFSAPFLGGDAAPGNSAGHLSLL